MVTHDLRELRKQQIAETTSTINHLNYNKVVGYYPSDEFIRKFNEMNEDRKATKGARALRNEIASIYLRTISSNREEVSSIYGNLVNLNDSMVGEFARKIHGLNKEVPFKQMIDQVRKYLGYSFSLARLKDKNLGIKSGFTAIDPDAILSAWKLVQNKEDKAKVEAALTGK